MLRKLYCIQTVTWIGQNNGNTTDTAHISLLIRWWTTFWITGLRLALSKGVNWVGVFLSRLKTEIDAVSETSCPILPRIPDDGKSPKPQLFCESFSKYDYRFFVNVDFCPLFLFIVVVFLWFVDVGIRLETVAFGTPNNVATNNLFSLKTRQVSRFPIFSHGQSLTTISYARTRALQIVNNC
jgi:hypothetical protein